MRALCWGIPICAGVGIGRLLVLQGREELVEFPLESENSACELERFRQAVKRFSKEMEQRACAVEDAAGAQQGGILRSHVMMLRDPYMVGKIEEKIAAMQSAEYAVSTVSNQFIAMFSGAKDDVTVQRAADIEDIRDGVLRLLMGIPELDLDAMAPGTILVTEELAPSVAARLDPRKVVGIVTRKGGKTAHSAILAKAMEIPCIMGAGFQMDMLQTGEQAVLDGESGEIIFSPEDRELAEFRIRQGNFRRFRATLEHFQERETRTADGEKISLSANAGDVEDIRRAMEYSGEGVGLFRTELYFLDCAQLPGEEEQLAFYRQCLLNLRGAPLTFRVLDIGGDKFPAYLTLEKEANPYLGLRGIRFLQKNREILHTQLRAALRAGVCGNLRLLVPFLSDVEEVRWFRKEVEQVKGELKSQGIPFAQEVPIGVMIETASSVVVADLLAREADFFCIGTNDLTQYFLAVDRGNSQVAYLYSYYAPALLRSISHIVDCGKEARIPVCLCGEAAADPLFTPLALGAGIRALSVSPAAVLPIRRTLSLWSVARAEALWRQALTLESEEEVKALLGKEKKE